MFVLSNFIIALAKIIDIALTIYMWIIIFRALISWVNPDPYNQIVIFLYRVTEPVLGPIRRKLPWQLGDGFFTGYCFVDYSFPEVFSDTNHDSTGAAYLIFSGKEIFFAQYDQFE